MRIYHTKKALVLTLFIVVIMLFSSVFAVGNMYGSQLNRGNSTPVEMATLGMDNNVVFELDLEHFISVPVAPLSI